MISFATHSVTRLRPVWTTDRRNARVREPREFWGRATLRGVSIEDTQATRFKDDERQTEQIDAVMYARPGADIEHDDIVVHCGQDYIVSTKPIQRLGPSGALAHTFVTLRRWEQ